MRNDPIETPSTLDGNGVPTDAGGSFTSWSFDSQRGWLNAKEYPDGQDAGTARDPGPSYTYTAAGRLRTRTWGGGKHTRYDYRQGLLAAKRHFTAATADNGTNVGDDPETPDVGQSYNNRVASKGPSLSKGGLHPRTHFPISDHLGGWF